MLLRPALKRIILGRVLSETLFVRAAETIISNMANGAAQSNCFDGNTNQAMVGGAGAVAFCSGAAGYIGIDFGAGVSRVISRAICYGANDEGYVFGSNPSTTLTLYGKATAPASGTDGTSIGNTGAFTDTAGIDPRTITSTDLIAAYRYVWVNITGGGASSTQMAELQIYYL